MSANVLIVLGWPFLSELFTLNPSKSINSAVCHKGITPNVLRIVLIFMGTSHQSHQVIEAIIAVESSFLYYKIGNITF